MNGMQDDNTQDPIPVTVIGLGHVGLITALGLAELGCSVTGTDADKEKLALIQDGQVPFYEPGLPEALRRHLDAGRFSPLADIDQAIQGATAVFVCVGTPEKPGGAADLAAVERVAMTIARNRNGYKLVVSKSTTPVMTTQRMSATIDRYGDQSHEFDVACNPEFLREGSGWHDFLHPDRVVLGVSSDRARDLLLRIYEPLDCPKVVTDPGTAELIKHAANAFLSTKISFINMVADLCEATGADVTKVAEAIGLDPRIGPAFLSPGIGFGGYCLPKDIRAFISVGETHGVDFSLLAEVERINLSRIDRLVSRLKETMWVLEGKTVAVLGLSFKDGTDDLRESPSLGVMERLLAEGALLRLYDPQAMDAARTLHPERAGVLTYAGSPYEAAQGAHALLLLTVWDEFRDLDWKRIKELMDVPLIGDARNLLDPATLRGLGFEYFSVGRP